MKRACLLLACAWLVGCSALSLSRDIALEGCQSDADCASLGELDAGWCGGTVQAFVCGDEGVCQRSSTPSRLDAAAGDCPDATAGRDGGAASD